MSDLKPPSQNTPGPAPSRMRTAMRRATGPAPTSIVSTRSALIALRSPQPRCRSGPTIAPYRKPVAPEGKADYVRTPPPSRGPFVTAVGCLVTSHTVDPDLAAHRSPGIAPATSPFDSAGLTPAGSARPLTVLIAVPTLENGAADAGA